MTESEYIKLLQLWIRRNTAANLLGFYSLNLILQSLCCFITFLFLFQKLDLALLLLLQIQNLACRVLKIFLQFRISSNLNLANAETNLQKSEIGFFTCASSSFNFWAWISSNFCVCPSELAARFSTSARRQSLSRCIHKSGAYKNINFFVGSK